MTAKEIKAKRRAAEKQLMAMKPSTRTKFLNLMYALLGPQKRRSK